MDESIKKISVLFFECKKRNGFQFQLLPSTSGPPTSVTGTNETNCDFTRYISKLALEKVIVISKGLVRYFITSESDDNFCHAANSPKGHKTMTKVRSTGSDFLSSRRRIILTREDLF